MSVITKSNNLNNYLEKLVEIRYDQLKSLRDNALLVPGQQYRITDYECSTTTANTKSAGHKFDIIVKADSENKLNENARACQSTNDEVTSPAKFYSESESRWYTRKSAYDGYFKNDKYYAWQDDSDTERTYITYSKTTEPIRAKDLYFATDGDDNSWTTINNAQYLTNFEDDGHSFDEFVAEVKYFDDCNLNAWELKYCIDNDSSRFAWAGDIKNGCNFKYYKDEGTILVDNDYVFPKIPADSFVDKNSKYYYFDLDKSAISTATWKKIKQSIPPEQGGLAIKKDLYDYCINSKYNLKDAAIQLGILNNFDNIAVRILDPTKPSALFVFPYANVEEGEKPAFNIKGTSYTAKQFNIGGKGVIYYMKDEYGNECPYDFKNIKYFKSLYGITEATDGVYTFGVCTYDEKNDKYYFRDGSIMKSKNTFNNKISNYSEKYNNQTYRLILPFIFISQYTNCFDNKFGNNCHDISFVHTTGIINGQTILNNTFSGNSNNLRFGGYTIKSNTIEAENTNWNINYNFDGNTVGTKCKLSTGDSGAVQYNVIGNNNVLTFTGKAINNVFGNNNTNSTLGALENCIIGNSNNYINLSGKYNILGNFNGASGKTLNISGNQNKVGNQNKNITINSSYNTFDNMCQYITLSNTNSGYNIFGSNCQNIQLTGGTSQYNVFGGGCSNVHGTGNDATFKFSYNILYSTCQNITIDTGVNARNMKIYSASTLNIMQGTILAGAQNQILVYRANFDGKYYANTIIDEEKNDYISEDYGESWRIRQNGIIYEIDKTGDTETEFVIDANKLYRFGTKSELSITFNTGEAGVVNEYMFEFSSGSTATTLNVPNTVKWVKTPSIQANKTYQVSILNNLGVIGEWS